MPLHAAGTETLLQKMKREGTATAAPVEEAAPSVPAPVMPEPAPPAIFPEPEPEVVIKRPAPEIPVQAARPAPAVTRPARPLDWPPEHYMEAPNGDEGDEGDKKFKTLRVPVGEAQPEEIGGRQVVTFTAPGAAPIVENKAENKEEPVTVVTGAGGVDSMPHAPPAVPFDEKAYSGYILGPGDKLKITVFGEEDLSGNFTVNDAGQISYPLVGEVTVRNLTVLRVKDEITALLREGYLKDPNLSIEVVEFRPFYITGEVRAPGSYSYVADMSIMNAVVLAGGFTFRADEDDIEVTRATASGNIILEDQDPEEKVVPGDIITVKERFF